jgi:DNA-binding CsgD family transcriptional regulator
MPRVYYKRNCPGCGNELTYKHVVSFDYAAKHEQKCSACSAKQRESSKHALSPETISSILEMNAGGILNREIARTLGIHHRTVSYHLKKSGREQNWANQPIDMLSDSKARCRKCGDIRSIDEFQFGRKGQKYEYRFSYCNKCRKKQAYLNLNSGIDKFLIDKYHRLVNRGKKLDIICTVSCEEFIAQYHKQEGKCFYTDEEMVCEVGAGKHRNSLSVDKIVPTKGYVVGNFVFATNKINTCKSDLTLDEIKRWMPEWYARIEKFIGGRRG